MLWLSVPSLAQETPVPPPAEDPPVLELTGEGRRSFDVEVFVRYDGNLYFADDLVMKDDLAAMLEAHVAKAPDARVVIAADARAPYEAIVDAMRIAREAGATRTAIQVAGIDLPTEADPLFPGTGEVEQLGETLDKKQLRQLKPKRWKFPQNPYGNTNSYTAYALEWGETKIGPGSIQIGLVPRIQVGTVPVLDAVGVFNVTAKANLMREGPLDGALLAQYYLVPITSILTSLGVDQSLADGTTFTTSASYLGLGATGSLQVVDPWSIHLQGYWARPSAKGEIAFGDLPEVLLPGLSIGGDEIALGVVGDLAVLNVATDVRFNRRDSVFAWLRYPFYGAVRGVTGSDVPGFEGVQGNAELAVQYEQFIPIGSSYSVAAGYQASWKHFEARIGAGWSAIPLTWLLQAFEVSYKFGGTTRRSERVIRKGFKENRRELEDAPAPVPPTEAPPPGG